MSRNDNIGNILKDLRRKQGLTGAALGRKAGLSQSKISKIETGYNTSVQLKDVEAILNILEAPNNIRQEVRREFEISQPQSLTYKPYRTHYDPDYYTQELPATTIRVFTLQGIPASLQTTAFRMAALRSFGVEDDKLTAYMQDTIKRQDLLWDKERSFHFILHNLMLYSAPAGKWDLLPPQLDRIGRLMELPNVKIGIIPLTAGLPRVEFGPFALHDQNKLYMAMAEGDVLATDADSIARYNRIYAELDRLALYGEPAMKLLHSVDYGRMG